MENKHSAWKSYWNSWIENAEKGYPCNEPKQTEITPQQQQNNYACRSMRQKILLLIDNSITLYKYHHQQQKQ